MARLKTLDNRLSTIAQRLPLTQASTTTHQRIRGSAAVKLRAQAMQAGQHICRRCMEQGIYTNATVVDHRIPLHMNGTNELDNLDPLCKQCHDAKTAQEAAQRARGWAVGI